MNILIPAHHFTDDPKSGLHTVIWNTAKHLAEKGHNVFVAAMSIELKSETIQSLKLKKVYLYPVVNFETHNLDKAGALGIFLFSVCLRLFHKFDWIYVIDTSITPFSRFKLGAKLACRVLNPKTPEVEAILNGPDWSYDRARKDFEENWHGRNLPLLYRLLRFFALQIWFPLFPVKQVGENADIIFCQGKDTEKFYRTLYGKKAIYLPNGVEDYRIDLIPDRQSLSGRFIYLFAGRIAKRKGVFYLLEAFKKLSAIHDDLKLQIAGKGSRQLTEDFKTLAGHLIGENKVELLGEKNRAEMIRLIKEADVVVDPMIYQGFSTIALEGLYCAKPVIGSMFGGTKDFVIDGQSGFLVDARNVEELKNKMEFYYLHPEESAKMAESGRRYVKDNLTWLKVADIIDKYFSGV